MLKNKIWLGIILSIVLLVSSIGGFAYYKYTQESGTNFYVGIEDKADALEDTNEVRQILDDLGNLLGHSKRNDLYPKDKTTGGTIQIPEAGLKFGNNPINGDIAAYIAGEMAWQTPAELSLATSSNKLSYFATTTSAELAGVISDETGSGVLVFGTDPSFTTRIRVYGNISATENIEITGTGWGIFPNKVGIGTVPNLTDGVLQILGNMDVSEAVRFMDSEGNIDNILYTSGAYNITILRNHLNDSTVLAIHSKVGDPTVDDRESTLSLIRTDDSGNEEYFDLYNNGYHSANMVQHGIRIQKRGTGQYRDFVFDYYDGITVDEIMRLTAGGDVGIGTSSPSGNLDINAVTDADAHILLSENDVTKWDFYNDHNDDALQIKAGNTLVAELDTSGNFDIKAGASYKIDGTALAYTDITGAGDMAKAVYDTDTDNIVDKAETVDDGVGNSSTAEDVKDAVTKKHTSGSETQGGDISGTVGNASVNKIKRGLDASKSATPAVGDIYLATDTDKLYKCITAEAWTLLKNLDLSGNNVADLADITSAGANIEDAVTKKHTAGSDTTLGTMTADVNMGTHKITGVVDPVDAQDAATKAYADTKVATEVDPTVDSDAKIKVILVDEVTKTGDFTAGRIAKINNATGIIEQSDIEKKANGGFDFNANSTGFTTQTATGEGATTCDWKLGNAIKFTFGAQNETFTFTNPEFSCRLILLLKQDAIGSRTVIWPESVKWAGGAAPTLTTATNAIDKIEFFFDDSDDIYYGEDKLDFK